jgi:hypothetical protein
MVGAGSLRISVRTTDRTADGGRRVDMVHALTVNHSHCLLLDHTIDMIGALTVVNVS